MTQSRHRQRIRWVDVAGPHEHRVPPPSLLDTCETLQEGKGRRTQVSCGAEGKLGRSERGQTTWNLIFVC